MRRLLTIAAVLLVGGATACANPCEKLADKACAHAGAGSEECEKIRELAERSSAEERRDCGRALTLVETLDKQQ